MHILVTGGAGYIGSITTRALLDAGHECTVLDTLENGHRWAVDNRATFKEGNVGDRTLVRDALDGVDCVMHLAGYIEVAESVTNPEKYFKNNVDAPRIMLEEMVRLGIGKLVFSSTAAVYGDPSEIPLTESAQTSPINPYGESKLCFERLLDEYTPAITSIRFRYFNAAGASPDARLGESHDPETHLIPRALHAVIDRQQSFTIFGDGYPTKDGTCVRDYIHVCDLAQAHLLGIEALGRDEPGGVYNLGVGNGFSNLEVLIACKDITGSTLEIVFGQPREGDPAVLVASSEAARRRFGWCPAYSDLSTIIDHAYAWHTTHS